MLYIMLRSGMMGYLRAMGKPLSALPEDALRTGALNEKENAVDMRHCLYVYFCMKGYFHSYLSY